MIHILWRFTAAAVLVIAAESAVAIECVEPGRAPVMPQGATFSKSEMDAGKVARDKFVDAVEAFVECQQKRIATAPRGTKEETLQSWRDSIREADNARIAVNFIFQSQMWAYENRKR